jgi:hypothetical protein
MPRELEFKFQPSARQDDKAIADAEDVRIRNGSLTLNEARAKNGLPLLDAEAADQPIMVATGAFILTDDGAVPLDSTSDTVTAEPIESEPIEAEIVPEPKASKSDLPADIAEMAKFKKWLRKSPKKAFKFNFVPEAYAETLNKFVAAEDYEAAKWYAEIYA